MEYILGVAGLEEVDDASANKVYESFGSLIACVGVKTQGCVRAAGCVCAGVGWHSTADDVAVNHSIQQAQCEEVVRACPRLCSSSAAAMLCCEIASTVLTAHNSDFM